MGELQSLCAGGCSLSFLWVRGVEGVWLLHSQGIESEGRITVCG